MTHAQAYGRVGLLGNPSDIYGGKCISFTIDSQAEVEVCDSLRLRIEENEGNGGIEDTLAYNGNHDLIKATMNKLKLQDKKIHIKYKTEIPVGSGLAGSSAIIIAAMRALTNILTWD